MKLLKKIVLFPVKLLAKPIDSLIDKISSLYGKKAKQREKIAKHSSLYSDFSVKAAKEGNVSFKEHLAVFRTNSLSPFEALYNACAVKISEKGIASRNRKKERLDIPTHPLGWEDEQKTIYKPNIWDHMLKLLSVFPNTVRYFHKLTKGIKGNFGRIMKFGLVGATVTVCAVLTVGYIENTVNEDVQILISINGNEIGYVENRNVVDSAVSEANTYMSSKTDTSYLFSGNIEYTLKVTDNSVFLSKEQLCADIIDIAKSEYVSAYVLYVDDTRVAANKSYAGISSALDSVKNAKVKKYVDMGIENATVRISNSIRIENLLCKEESLCSTYDIYLMLNDSDDIIFYLNDAVQSSDDPTFIDNPFEEETQSDEIIDISPLSTGNDLPQQSILNFVTLVTAEERISVDFETIYEYSEYYESGVVKLKTEGKCGEILNRYDVSYDNDGNEISRKLVSSEYISAPVPEVYYVGVANAPQTGASGVFQYPVSGGVFITSPYGDYRSNTGSHFGIDLNGSLGDPILASDGGTVTFAGSSGSYGKLVIIDHGNGYETYYAHMSKIYVEVGDEVYPGQNIGQIGKTGNASAAHLHFEVHYNNARINPLDVMPEIEFENPYITKKK